MTSPETFAQTYGQQPMVKCSTCAANVDLSRLAEHQCYVPSYVSQPHYTDEPAYHAPSPIYPPRDGPELPRQRPVLPKIDSNPSNRSARGLGAREAANIAHDLGLPSPVSAGGGRRSPRPHNLRKVSSPRLPRAPPSPELSTGQDCAFPAFPMSKPKRSNTEKVIKNPKPIVPSRAGTHDAATSHSASSSTYSSSSGGFTKGRTSDTSWQPISRQGTIDETPRSPSTAPSSPRTSLFDQEKSNTIDHGANRSADTSASSTGPRSAYEQQNNSLPFRRIEGPDESEASNDRHDRANSLGFGSQENWQTETKSSPVTFDSIFNSSTQPNHGHGNHPVREPSYKAKRPPPLDQSESQSQAIAPEFQFAPLSSRSPSTSSNTGLTRSLTKIFGRKRSQSVSSKKSAKFDVNGPRMKALAPEPPPVPLRGQGEFGLVRDDQESYFSSKPRQLASPSFFSQDAVSPLTAAEQAVAIKHTSSPHGEGISPLSVVEHTHAPVEDPTAAALNVPRQKADFNFDFGGTTNANLSRKPDHLDNGFVSQTNTNESLHGESANLQSNANRASIDSASDYGSVRYSQQSIDLDSVPQAPPSFGNKISSALRDSTSSFDMGSRLQNYAGADIHNHHSDPSYAHGSLSPVREGMVSVQPHIMPNIEGSESSETKWSDTGSSPSQSPSKRRLAIPAANKGVCRGCSIIIEAGQKSVSSKDGRLTGRYHKECFTCRTCKQPFATADFYIFEDHPYCGHHYHVMNDTLCTSCGDGIEGQYLQTFDVTGKQSKKFHPRCLTCSTCRIQLQDDYFEFQGHVYCEKDAFRAANGPIRSPYDNAPSRPSPLVREYISSGEPGTKGRFPERRTTRLMMM